MEKKAGRPYTWKGEKLRAIIDLLDRFNRRDEFFYDETFQEIAEAVPTFVHFVSIVQEKWGQVQKEYPQLKSVKRPPGRATLLLIDELQPGLEVLRAKQERGLLYGSLSGQLASNIATLMLQDHGYVKKNASEITGKDGESIEISIAWGKKPDDD